MGLEVPPQRLQARQPQARCFEAGLQATPGLQEGLGLNLGWQTLQLTAFGVAKQALSQRSPLQLGPKLLHIYPQWVIGMQGQQDQVTRMAEVEVRPQGAEGLAMAVAPQRHTLRRVAMP